MENLNFVYDAEKVAERAFDLVKPAIEMLLKMEGSEHLHIVVMDPRFKPWECEFSRAVAKEFSIGDKSQWECDYQKFARNKARQSYYCDSFFYYGVIVACSGLKQNYDTMVSGWIAIAFQQIWKEQFKKAKAAYPDKNFIEELVFP